MLVVLVMAYGSIQNVERIVLRTYGMIKIKVVQRL